MNFGQTRFANAPEQKHILTSNPGRIMVNDISIGIVNTDVLKDMCINMLNKHPSQNPSLPGQVKEEPPKKIDLVLQSILQ